MNNDAYDSSFIAEALPAFVSEAHEHISMLEQLLLQLETNTADRHLLDALFRCAHTIKGSAGIFGVDRVVAFTHHVETLLEQMRGGQKALTPDISTLLLQCNDQIRALVNAAGDPRTESAEALRIREALVQRLRAAYGDRQTATSSAAVAGVPTLVPSAPPGRWQISVRFGVDTFRNGMDPLAIFNYLQGIGSIVDLTCDVGAVPGIESIELDSCHLAFDFGLESSAAREAIDSAFNFVRDDCTLKIVAPEPAPDPVGDGVAAVDAVVDAPKPRDGTAKARAADDSRFIRVEADRLDDVINLLGELVIASAGASLLARQSRQGSLIEANQQITSLVEEIRNGTLQLRMVPIGDTFARFRRVVRDTAAELGKDIVLEVIGGDTELDKSVVERIVDPLMHLVRNALDHGLETPAQRLNAGKPPKGTLTLAACHESGSIVIRISDDGRGINREKVLQRAWERGLIAQGVVPGDQDILDLIFEPGFSTAEQVTNLSGRGVGMDVVRRNVEALRGAVGISSEPGRGSSIEVRLPLTLAIIDGFLIGVGPSKFIFPLDTVIEVIESRGTDVSPKDHGRSIVELRGHMLPVVNLRSLFALDSPEPERTSIVVIQSGAHRFGVMVDVLLGQHQTVIKPLGRLLNGLRGISGSTILGSGEVAMIIDGAALGELAGAMRSTGTMDPTTRPESFINNLSIPSITH
jgi:two-component system chemotaxis sensor kinase CheA